MEVASEAEDGTIDEPAASIQFGAIAGLTAEVPTEPRLPLAEECLDVWLRTSPAPATARRYGHDHTSVGVDHDPQSA